MSETISQLLDTFNTFTKKPEKFLSAQPDIIDDVKGFVKKMYDFTKNNEIDQPKGNALPELIIENFDDEQIWQELELQNEDCNHFISQVSQLVAKKDRLTFPVRLKDDKDSEESIANDIEESDDMQSENDSELEDELDLQEEESEENGEELFDSDLEKKIAKKKGKSKSSIVDDKFFKLSDMERFLEEEEKNEGKFNQSSEIINYFEDTPSIGIQDPTENMYYSDFFAPVEDTHPEGEESEQNNMKVDSDDDEELNMEGSKDNMEDEEVDENDGESEELDEEEDDRNSVELKKQVRFNLNDEDDDDDDDDDNDEDEEEVESKDIKNNNKIANENDDEGSKVKSTLELRQERLGKLINKLEEEAISDKPWQLKGEITGGARPPNSLLEEVVDFDISARPAPVMTEEVTLRLEDIIMRRIKDKSWDDVERKIKPVETPSEFKKKLVLDQEKSKLSLAEVYEQEYIKQRDAAKQHGDDTEEQEVEPPLHHEVRSMMTSLFNKLDALSNYHYTPRPAVPELKIISNERAITIEEVAPVATTDATLLAPEEIQGKKRGDLIGKNERTATDKKRARRLKKRQQREKQKSKEHLQKTINKLNPGLGNKYSKQKVEETLKKVLNERNVSKMEEKTNKAVRSSSTFFRNLQDEVSSTIKSQTQPLKRKKVGLQLSAKKLKL